MLPMTHDAAAASSVFGSLGFKAMVFLHLHVTSCGYGAASECSTNKLTRP